MELDKLLEEVACPLCESHSDRVLRTHQYPEHLDRNQLLEVYRSSSDHQLMDQLVQCNDCDLVYLNPRVKSEIGMDSYTQAEDPTFVEQDALRIATFSRALRRLEKRLAIEPKDTRVLDIGCAGGAFPKAASDRGYQVTGIEPSRWLCDYGKKKYGLDIRPGTLESGQFEKNTFDLITYWDVLEHVYDPKALLSESLRILKSDGYLVVNYPDYASLARKVLRDKWPFFLSVHLYYFTPKTVTRLLEEAGYTVLSISPHWQTLQLGYVLQRAAAYFGLFGPLGSLCRRVGLGNVPLTYQVGQTLVIAKPCKK